MVVKEKYRFNECAGGGFTGLGAWLLGKQRRGVSREPAEKVMPEYT